MFTRVLQTSRGCHTSWQAHGRRASRLGASSKSNKLKPSVKARTKCFFALGVTGSLLESKFEALKLKFWWWESKYCLRWVESLNEEREIALGWFWSKWMREVEDDRCGGNMGKWKFTQKLNGQIKCGSAAPNAAVPLQECGTAAQPGPARMCMWSGWTLGYMLVEILVWNLSTWSHF